MNENLAKICRICLTEGSRHIFHKTVTNDALYNVSSLNRISEKLRYVTLLKIDEMENLPPMICDLCIVQLNVAYNFKRQATESDTKLRQYLIENGIDIMKDIRALPAAAAIRAPPTQTAAVPERLLPNRTNQRVISTSSSSVFEVPQTTGNSVLKNSGGTTFEPRLVPIRIKVETPETVEHSSETGDLLSNSTISPLSSVTAANGVAPVTLVTTDKTNRSVNIEVEWSPSSSKNSGSSDGRESAMVVVDCRNISMQGDEDYVQNILGSNSSLSTNASKSVEKVDLDAEKPKKDKHADDQTESPQERRLKTLLSTLRINMVNSRFPQSKLRTKPRKKLQQLKLKQQLTRPIVASPKLTSTKPAPKPAPKPVHKPTAPKPKTSPTKSLPKVARRHSLDLAQLLNGTRVKREQARKNKSPEKNKCPRKATSSVITPNKLRSLRDKMREERERINGTASKSKDVAAMSPLTKTHDDKAKAAS